MAIKPDEEIVIQSRRFIGAVDRDYPIRFGYLFGSRARGETTGLSDIDIAVYFQQDYPAPEETLIRGDLMERGGRYFGGTVDIVSLRRAGIFLKYAVVRDGIPIKDGTGGARADFESLTLREYFDFRYYSDIYNNAMIADIKAQTYFGGGYGR
jgi:predicted nucleotidyltransferase